MAILTGTARNRFAGFPEPDQSGPLKDVTKNILGFFESLATHADQFQASYTEDGFYETPAIVAPGIRPVSEKMPSQRRQIAQRPKTTIFVKKKQFGSLSTNNELRMLDEDEKLYLRCVKALFRRKCDEMAFHESLVNISSIYETAGFLLTDDLFNDSLDYLINVVGSLSGASSIISSIGSNSLVGGAGVGGFGDSVLSFIQGLYRAKKASERSRASAFTRWVDDPTEADYAGLGPGAGTIELNAVSSLNSSCGLNDSSASLDIEDPYQLMLITAADIENALYVSTSRSYQISSFYDGTASFRLALAQNADRRLNSLRSARGQKEIMFEYVQGKDGEMDPAATLGYVDAAKLKFYQWIGGIRDAADREEALAVGLTTEEISLLNQVISSLIHYRDASTIPPAQPGLNASERDLRRLQWLRDKMRRDFLGQHVIQPMDQITIFANSNTYDITPVGGIVDVISGASARLTDTIDPYIIEQERRSILGQNTGTDALSKVNDFALSALYSSIRKKNLFRDDGACIFSGLAESVSDSYDSGSGSFKISVSCQSNLHYLEISRYTLTPSLNNTLGAVMDPVTPFDIQDAIDPASGLITQSVFKLSQKNEERLDFLRIASGPLVSKKIRNIGDILTDKRNGLAIIEHTPGLVYKWKEGIVSVTVDAAGGGGVAGGISSLRQPFAKLDAANIASILITGQPYDYATFFEGVSKISGAATNPTNLSRDFFNYMFEYTDRVKKYYGSFVPAKDRSLDKDTVMAYYQAKNALSTLNVESNRLITKLNDLRRKQPVGAEPTAEQTKITEEITRISSDIANLQQSLPEGLQLSLEGNNTFISVDALDRVQTDREIIYKTKRKPEDVRFNKDKNYFIVSADYDTDFIIQSFAASLSGNFSLFEAEYSSPLDTIRNAISALQLEFFADPDGNLVLRPPRYNRTPLSLMIEMIRQMPPGQNSLLPSFVQNVLASRTNSLWDAMLKNELNIARELYSIGLSSTAVSGNEGSVYPLLLYYGSRSEFALNYEAVNQEIIKAFSAEGGTKVTSSFVLGPASRVKTIESAISKKDSENAEIQQRLRDVIVTMRSIPLGPETKDQALIDKAEKEAAAALAKLKLDNAGNFITSRLTTISGYLNTRRTLLRSLYDASKRESSTGVSPFDKLGASTLSLLGTGMQSGLGSFGSIFGASLPPALESIIENDLTNIDGPGSGKRFIINDAVVLRGSFSHRPPDFNNVAVSGAVDFLSPEASGNLADIPVLTATATDFDSWRQYGFREASPMRRPDMTSAETQCAPYASLMLATQRRKIHSGRITVIGNEYYRPGDNVYLSYRNMIYYVTNVSHNISLNDGSFTTELELSYGRPPGEIIPTPLDILGNAPSNAALLTKKYRKAGTQDKASAQTSKAPTIRTLGTFHIANPLRLRINLENDEGFRKELTNIIKSTNAAELSSVALQARARAIISPTKGGKSGKIEVRGYYIPYNDDAQRPAANVCCDIIVKLLQESLSEGGAARTDAAGDAASGAQGQQAAVPDAGEKSAVQVEKRLVDLTADFGDEERLLLPFPTEDAWLSAAPVKVGEIGSEKTIDLPVNAFDIIFIA